MIKGSEILKEKYKTMLTLDELVHNISGGSQTYQLGLTTGEAYVGLVEQNIGQDVYEKYFKLEASYTELYSVTEKYIQEKDQYNQLVAQIKIVAANIQSLEKDILKLEEKRKALVEKSNVSPKEEKEIERITGILYTKKVDLQAEIVKKNELKEKIKEQETICSAYLSRINKIKEIVAKRLEEVDKLAGSFDVFRDKNFEENIEQDFIDACLLPDEENKEQDLRTIAKSKFLMMKFESLYLEKVKDYSLNLVNSLNSTNHCRNLVDLELPKQVVAERMSAKGLDYLSTEFLCSSDIILNEKAIAEFYIYTYNQIVNTELGANPNMEYCNLPAVAMQQFKIPQNTLVGIKGQISQALHGYSTMFNIECLNPLFYGARDLQKAQEILKDVRKDSEFRL